MHGIPACAFGAALREDKGIRASKANRRGARMHLLPKHHFLKTASPKFDSNLLATQPSGMSKRQAATKHGVGHGNKNSTLHKDDVQKNKELRTKQRSDRQEPREVVTPEEEPKFASNVSALKSHGCYRVVNGVPVPMEGKEWETALWETCLHLNWYHQLQTRKTKSGISESYKRRTIKDRVTLGKTDKHARPETDINRETIDLRPDHTRAIQYLLEQGRKKEAEDIVEEARIIKIRLFEKIYGRRVIFEGDHDDSGQHHDDLWHTGIEEDETQAIRGREGKKWVSRAKRTRTPFLSYGVGIGAASWSRHFSALRDARFSQMQIEILAKPTVSALQDDTLQVRERHQCAPRDVRLLAMLDRLVHRKLMRIAPVIAEKANREYAQFLEENYRAGGIGVKKSKRSQITELRKVADDLQAETEKLNAKINELLAVEMEAREAAKVLNPTTEESLAMAAERVIRDRHAAILEKTLLVERIAEVLKAFLDLGKNAACLLGSALLAAIENLAKAVGIDLGSNSVPIIEGTGSPNAVSAPDIPDPTNAKQTERTNEIL